MLFLRGFILKPTERAGSSVLVIFKIALRLRDEHVCFFVVVVVVVFYNDDFYKRQNNKNTRNSAPTAIYCAVGEK